LGSGLEQWARAERCQTLLLSWNAIANRDWQVRRSMAHTGQKSVARACIEVAGMYLGVVFVLLAVLFILFFGLMMASEYL
jgi:hypothetical protein